MIGSIRDQGPFINNGTQTVVHTKGLCYENVNCVRDDETNEVVLFDN